MISVDNLVVRNKLVTSSQTGGTLHLLGTGSRQPAVEKALLVQGGATIAGVLTAGTLDVTANATVYGEVTADGGFGAVSTAAVTLNGLLTCDAVSTALFANEFYVAPGGSDVTGDGTVANPFATIGKAVLVGEEVRGTIILQPGTYVEDVVVQSCMTLVGKGDVVIRGDVRISISSAITPGTVALLSLRVEGQVTDRVFAPALAGDHVLVMTDCTVAYTGNGTAIAISGTAASTHYLTNCRIDATLAAEEVYMEALKCETGTATLTKCHFRMHTPTASAVEGAVVRLSCDARMDDCTVSLDVGTVTSFNAYLCQLLGVGKVYTVVGSTFNFTAEAPIGGTVYGAYVFVQANTTAYFVRNVFNLQDTTSGGAVYNNGSAYTLGNVALAGSVTGFTGNLATPLATI